MKQILSILAKILGDKEFSFKIDSDKDGKPFVQGSINLAELIDEASKLKH